MKKTLLISLIAGLFLAFTACGPDGDDNDDQGTPADTPQTVEVSSHTVYNALADVEGRTVTVASGEHSKTISSGGCVEVPESKLAGLVVSAQWNESAEAQVLCGGEGEGAVACEDRDVKVVPNADFTAAEFADSNISGCTGNVLGEEPQPEENEQGDGDAGDGDEGNGDGDGDGDGDGE